MAKKKGMDEFMNKRVTSEADRDLIMGKKPKWPPAKAKSKNGVIKLKD
jgi:hypothetical protein